jgi:hypothetical protein
VRREPNPYAGTCRKGSDDDPDRFRNSADPVKISLIAVRLGDLEAILRSALKMSRSVTYLTRLIWINEAYPGPTSDGGGMQTRSGIEL